MLIGTYYHKIDRTGRVSLPVSFRELSENWILTNGFDGCLFAFEESKFLEKITAINTERFDQKNNRDLARIIANNAEKVSTDKLGRITIPKKLIKIAKLGQNLAIVGSINYIEFWEQTTYQKYFDKINQGNN